MKLCPLPKTFVNLAFKFSTNNFSDGKRPKAANCPIEAALPGLKLQAELLLLLKSLRPSKVGSSVNTSGAVLFGEGLLSRYEFVAILLQ